MSGMTGYRTVKQFKDVDGDVSVKEIVETSVPAIVPWQR